MLMNEVMKLSINKHKKAFSIVDSQFMPGSSIMAVKSHVMNR